MARLAPQAERDLDDIWLYVATESGSIDIANRLIDTITQRFIALSRFPYIGRSRDEDLGPGLRTLSITDYTVVYRIDGEEALILRVVNGRRDFEALFNR